MPNATANSLGIEVSNSNGLKSLETNRAVRNSDIGSLSWDGLECGKFETQPLSQDRLDSSKLGDTASLPFFQYKFVCLKVWHFTAPSRPVGTLKVSILSRLLGIYWRLGITVTKTLQVKFLVTSDLFYWYKLMKNNAWECLLVAGSLAALFIEGWLWPQIDQWWLRNVYHFKPMFVLAWD